MGGDVVTTHSAEIDALVTERVRRHHATVEAACEAALQGGRHGVMVEWNADRTTAWVDPGVPYGEVHERVLPPAVTNQPVYGTCTHCGAVEVALTNATGTRDLSAIGESPTYPTGYGCELCDD